MDSLATRINQSKQTGAWFSDCGLFRYALWRRWSNRPLLLALMMNPSTADAEKNDPTVTRVIKRAKQLHYGGLIVTNFYAFRATDPAECLAAEDKFGPDNDWAIGQAAKLCDAVLAAYGTKVGGDGIRALRRVVSYGCTPLCLGLTKHGHPKHPLYVARAQPLIPFEVN